jgi:hypothetical protein
MSSPMSKLLLDPLSRKVRDGLFLAPSRTYAEQYVEPFIREFYGLFEPKKNDHDAVDDQGLLYEIKSCKVLKSNKVNNKKSKDILTRILDENSNVETNRMISFRDAVKADYLANVQNVKRDHFDVLIYVLLFEDCVKVFFCESSKIKKKVFVNWSDKHGRYDQEGKSGQFGITKSNLKWHIDNCLKDTISYREITKIYQKLSRGHVNKKHHNPK